MNTVAHLEIIGIDVSRDWLDLHCVSDGHQLRLRNTDDGHSELAKIAGDREVLVCFEATGGHEWRLWASLEAAGIEARQLVEIRKSSRQQAKANLKNGTADQVEDLSNELLDLLERQIAEVEERIGSLLANEAVLAETAAILRSVPGIGPVACAMPVAEMPELGRISGEQAAALAGLAPIARNSGQMRGKRMIGGGRRALRQVLYQAALVASIHNTDLKLFADRLRKEGKPHKVVVTAVSRKLVVIANALCKSRQPWTPQTG